MDPHSRKNADDCSSEDGGGEGEDDVDDILEDEDIGGSSKIIAHDEVTASNRLRSAKRRRKLKLNTPLSVWSDGGDDRRRVYMDLMVPVPSLSSTSNKQSTSSSNTKTRMLLLSSLIDRFESSGYSAIALTHTIYGTPTKDDILNPLTSIVTQLQAEQHRRRRDKNSNRNHRPLQLLTRLHAVVENLSDVGWYAQPPPTTMTEALSPEDDPTKKRREYLQQFDLVSLAPRNDATFQAACQSIVSGGGVDILTFDYSSNNTTSNSRGRLPFKIRTKDLQSANQRQVVLEIPYSPAMLHVNHRRAFIQTFRDIQTASLGLRPKIITSSGSRQVGSDPSSASSLLSSTEQNDGGVLALRMPGDLVNVLECVLHMDSKTAMASLTSNPQWVLRQATARQVPYNNHKSTLKFKIVSVNEEDEGNFKDATIRDAGLSQKPKTQRMPASSNIGCPPLPESNDQHEVLQDDGYIAL